MQQTLLRYVAQSGAIGQAAHAIAPCHDARIVFTLEKDFIMALPPNKQRSRRLRKKMHLDEFQEFGFEYELSLKEDLTTEQEDALMDRFVTELLAPRFLAAGGWVLEGFVTSYHRGSATDEDRAATLAWFRAQPEVNEASVSELKDAWYVED